MAWFFLLSPDIISGGGSSPRSILHSKAYRHWMYCFFRELAALLEVPTFRFVASSLHFLFLLTCNYNNAKAYEQTPLRENELRPSTLSKCVWTGCIYLCKTSNLLNGHVEAEEIKGLTSHSWQVTHAHGFFLYESQVTVYPHLSFWLWA